MIIQTSNSGVNTLQNCSSLYLCLEIFRVTAILSQGLDHPHPLNDYGDILCIFLHIFHLAVSQGVYDLPDQHRGKFYTACCKEPVSSILLLLMAYCNTGAICLVIN